jgi:hypothetical protein
MNEETIIKIKTSNVLADKWTRKSRSLSIPRSDYLNNLLLGRDVFPLPKTSTGKQHLPRSVDR